MHESVHGTMKQVGELEVQCYCTLGPPQPLASQPLHFYTQ